MDLETVFNTLTYREREVFKMRKGINGRFHTLDEVAQRFEVTTTRIKQIEATAVRKLQHPVRMKVIKELPEPLQRIMLEELS